VREISIACREKRRPAADLSNIVRSDTNFETHQRDTKLKVAEMWLKRVKT